jgi:hypothetical protein
LTLSRAQWEPSSRRPRTGGCARPFLAFIWNNGAMPAEYANTDALRGATFAGADLTGARFRDCDLRQVKIVDSWLIDVNVSGIVGNFVVNDVDVSAFVEAELDRRPPERSKLRQMESPDDYRAMWHTIERLWSETVSRAQRLPEPSFYERVDGEWSFVETLRHLVFATDSWVSRTILGESMPFHPLGLPHSSYPIADAAALAIDLDARPSLAQVIGVRAGRMALVRGFVSDLTATEIERVCQRASPNYPDELLPVGDCLRVVMREECEHHRYAIRDLAVLETR